MSKQEYVGKIQYDEDPVHKYIFENSLRLHPAQEKIVEVSEIKIH